MDFKGIFDNVAGKIISLVDNGRVDEDTAQTILESLITAMLFAGWDTADESLAEHLDELFIVQAFKECDIEMSYED